MCKAEGVADQEGAAWSAAATADGADPVLALCAWPRGQARPRVPLLRQMNMGNPDTLMALAEKIGSTKLMIVLIAMILMNVWVTVWWIRAGKNGEWVWGRELKDSREREQFYKDLAFRGVSGAESAVELAKRRRVV